MSADRDKFFEHCEEFIAGEIPEDSKLYKFMNKQIAEDQACRETYQSFTRLKNMHQKLDPPIQNLEAAQSIMAQIEAAHPRRQQKWITRFMAPAGIAACLMFAFLHQSLEQHQGQEHPLSHAMEAETRNANKAWDPSRPSPLQRSYPRWVVASLNPDEWQHSQGDDRSVELHFRSERERRQFIRRCDALLAADEEAQFLPDSVLDAKNMSEIPVPGTPGPKEQKSDKEGTLSTTEESHHSFSAPKTKNESRFRSEQRSRAKRKMLLDQNTLQEDSTQNEDLKTAAPSRGQLAQEDGPAKGQAEQAITDSDRWTQKADIGRSQYLKQVPKDSHDRLDLNLPGKASNSKKKIYREARPDFANPELNPELQSETKLEPEFSRELQDKDFAKLLEEMSSEIDEVEEDGDKAYVLRIFLTD